MSVNNIQAIQAFEAQYGTLGSSSDPYNCDAFTQLVDGAWEAIKQFNQNPSDLNTQIVMQEINQLTAYFQANGVPTDKAALALYNAIGSGPFSIGGVCAEYGTANAQAAITALENGTLSLNQVYSAMGAYGSVYNDEHTANGINADASIDKLLADLKAYDQLMAYDPSDTKDITARLEDLVDDIRIANAALAPGNVSDGYLTVMKTLLNTPISAKSSDTLESLAAAASKDPSKLADLQTALTTLGEGTSKNEGSLFEYLSACVDKEFGS